MKYVFNEDTFKSLYDIDIYEFFVLMLIKNDKNLDDILYDLKTKYLLFENNTITPKGSEITKKVQADNYLNQKIEKDNLKDLAGELQKLFPAGKKPGTNYYWRGFKQEIIKKLETISNKFDFEFTKEQAINATKRYVESFNGDYRYMQLLKYFILKNKITENGTEIKSSFMEYIENENNNEDNSMLNSPEWNNEIVN